MNRHFPALAHRNFRIFLLGQFLSVIGTWMQSTTQPYLAYRLTSQPIFLGLVGFSSTIPALFFTLPMGVYIERWDKRKTVIAMQTIMMLQAFTLGIITILGIVTIWHIIILAFVLGIANSVEITARQAMFIELTDKETLPNAIALNSSVFNAARVIGPSLAAPFLVLIQGNGEGWAFIANGVSYLFVIISLMMIQTRPVTPKPQDTLSLVESFKIGQRYIRETPLVAMLIVLVAIPGLFGYPFIQQIPVFASVVLKTAHDAAGDAAARNSLMVAFMGVGALTASLGLAIFSGVRRKGVLLMIGQAVFSLGLTLLSVCRTIQPALLLMIMLGGGMVFSSALTNTIIQLTVPDDLRGRVISTYFWAMQGVAPFGSLLLGWMIQTYGAPVSVLVCGSICLVSMTVIHIFNPTVRNVTG